MYKHIENEQLQYLVQLEEQQSNSSLDKIIHSYRGQIISIEELEIFQSSVRQYVYPLIVFFSTSKNKQVGLTCAQSNDPNTSSQIPVIFIIESDIDSPISTASFADIQHLIQFDNEEVLFMIGAVFHIVAVKLDSDIDNL
ncbi:unnamed protein product [Rotaria sp. Silwood1]|nr:unnamed protein product [Rotaria sp. Silwood1]CAF1685811.1 unnamed protein product [Rotaria sp. Silwood1]